MVIEHVAQGVRVLMWQRISFQPHEACPVGLPTEVADRGVNKGHLGSDTALVSNLNSIHWFHF